MLHVADPTPAPAPHAATHQTTAQQHAAGELPIDTLTPPPRSTDADEKRTETATSGASAVRRQLFDSTSAA